MEQALGHVTSLGHQRIGLLLGPADHVPSERKLRRPAHAVRQRHDLSSAPSWWCTRSTRWRAARPRRNRLIEARRHGDRLRQRPARPRRDPGGAPGAACACPADVSVVGYDDSALMNSHRPAPDHGAPADRADGPGGRRPARGLIAGSDVPRDELLFEPELVVRASTAAAKPLSLKSITLLSSSCASVVT